MHIPICFDDFATTCRFVTFFFFFLADGITPVPAATDLAPAPHDSATVTQCCGDATSRSFGATRLGGVASRTTVSPHRDPGAVWRKSRRFTDPAVDPAQAVGEGQNRSPEMWNHSQLTVPSSSESVPFGCPPTQTKTHYNVYVDGVFYQSWRYSQLNRLRHDLLDALHVEVHSSPPPHTHTHTHTHTPTRAHPHVCGPHHHHDNLRAMHFASPRFAVADGGG